MYMINLNKKKDQIHMTALKIKMLKNNNRQYSSDRTILTDNIG